jgi:hypothetical protein
MLQYTRKNKSMVFLQWIIDEFSQQDDEKSGIIDQGRF